MCSGNKNSIRHASRCFLRGNSKRGKKQIQRYAQQIFKAAWKVYKLHCGYFVPNITLPLDIYLKSQ
jgi:hypothetical protein